MIPTAVTEALGSQLGESSYASVLDLNELPPSLVEDARRLLEHKRLYVFAFLRHFLPRESHGDLDAFIDEVVASVQPARDWRRGDRFCSVQPDFPPLLAVTADEALARLRAVAGAGSLSIMKGAPGVLVPDTTYRWQAPSGIDSVAVPDSVAIEEVDDLRLAYRRWLASEFARYWFGVHPRSEEVPAGDLGAELSLDAAAALRGLRRELAELRSSAAPLGFRGPDDWYLSPVEAP